VDRYNDITLNDSMLRRNVIDLMVGTAEKTNDTLQMLDYLKIGISEYSNHPFYFTKLYEYFVNQEKYDEAYHLADSLSVVYPDSTLYSYSKVYPLIKVEKFDEAIEEANKVIQNDTMHVDLHYYLGFAYYKLANAIKLPTSINSSQYRTKSKIQKDYYKKALPHLEKYKSNYPENIDKWGYLLHDIYWALNMGKQYDEIIKVLNK
jgi:tetratricopeptide (TPR) repeat protein